MTPEKRAGLFVLGGLAVFVGLAVLGAVAIAAYGLGVEIPQ